MSFIDELIKGSISEDGYKQYIKFIYIQINIRNWPLLILEEHSYNQWNNDNIEAFAHQFIVYLFEKNKISYMKNIPHDLRYKFFQVILERYVADIIKEKQKEIIGVSYRDIKHIALDILNSTSEIIKTIILGNPYWCYKNYINKPILEQNKIENLLNILPKLNLPNLEKQKVHIKKKIQGQIKDIFNLIESPIEESYLINFVFNSFIKTSEKVTDVISSKEEVLSDYKEVIKKIINSTDGQDIKILKEYLLQEPHKSLVEASKVLSIPKSTLAYRANIIKKVIRESFSPQSEKDAELFLKSLIDFLDKNVK